MQAAQADQACANGARCALVSPREGGDVRARIEGSGQLLRLVFSPRLACIGRGFVLGASGLVGLVLVGLLLERLGGQPRNSARMTWGLLMRLSCSNSSPVSGSMAQHRPQAGAGRVSAMLDRIAQPRRFNTAC